MIVNDLRELLQELESRLLIPETRRRRRLPKRASTFIRNGIESCRDEGKTIRHCVTLTYLKAKRKGLL